MWKNRKFSENIKGVYHLYKVTGFNQDRFINTLHSKGITLLDLKKNAVDQMTFKVSVKENENFFAIIKNMCYTTDRKQLSSVETPKDLSIKSKKGRKKPKKRKEKPKENKNLIATKEQCGYTIERVKTVGKGYPVYFLACNFGLVLGAICFLILSVIINDFIFSFSFVGSGNIYKNQVVSALSEQGVYQGKRFSQFDLNHLSDIILAKSPNLSFVQCYKQGNKMVIELAISSSPSDTLDDNVKELRTDKSGQIESIKVYRGTPIVNQNDFVNEGDLLVAGYSKFNDTVIETSVLARVSLIVEWHYEYISDNDNSAMQAELFAKTILGDKQITDCLVSITQKDGEFIYDVAIFYRHILLAG